MQLFSADPGRLVIGYVSRDLYRVFYQDVVANMANWLHPKRNIRAESGLHSGPDFAQGERNPPVQIQRGQNAPNRNGLNHWQQNWDLMV